MYRSFTVYMNDNLRAYTGKNDDHLKLVHYKYSLWSWEAMLSRVQVSSVHE